MGYDYLSVGVGRARKKISKVITEGIKGHLWMLPLCFYSRKYLILEIGPRYVKSANGRMLFGF